MKLFTPISVKFFFSLIVLGAYGSSASGDIVLDTGSVAVQQGSGGGGLGGTSTFNVSAADISNVELLANFDIVDAGVDIRINGTSLFPQFDDISQFAQIQVFLDTGVTQGTGNVSSPFSPNDIGLPRLTVNSTSAGTNFSGAAFTNSSSVIDYTPNFAVQDFSSLLVEGDNTIQFFVLNSFEGANLQGDFTVTLGTAVPEPSVTGLGIFALVCFLSRRRR